MICSTGDRPGEGTYKCYTCGEKIVLEDHDVLPECDGCSSKCFKRK